MGLTSKVENLFIEYEKEFFAFSDMIFVIRYADQYNKIDLEQGDFHCFFEKETDLRYKMRESGLSIFPKNQPCQISLTTYNYTLYNATFIFHINDF